MFHAALEGDYLPMQSFSFLILFWGICIKMINLVLCGRNIEHNVHHLILTGTFIYILHILAHRKQLKTLHQKMLPHTYFVIAQNKTNLYKKKYYLLFNMYMYILLILLWFKEKHNIFLIFDFRIFLARVTILLDWKSYLHGYLLILENSHKTLLIFG